MKHFATLSLLWLTCWLHEAGTARVVYSGPIISFQPCEASGILFTPEIPGVQYPPRCAFNGGPYLVTPDKPKESK